jgi:hypothetical protein
VESDQRRVREILPSTGIWSVEDLALYLGLPSATVQQKLSNAGIKVISFSSRYKHKLFNVEHLANGKSRDTDEFFGQR